jgi:glycerol-3-phosphate dehydrogenase (NAD(P)+)
VTKSSPARRIAVFGAGSYGTALALQLARNGVTTNLWARDPKHVEQMHSERHNRRFLDAPFPELLSVTADLSAAVASANDLLVVVPSHAFAECITQIAPLLTASHRVVWATKGLEPKTGRLLSEVAADYIGPDRAMGILSGPTFAKEMAANLPTAISLATNNAAFGQDIANYLHNPQSFRVYLNDDMIGVQLGGAVKNVIAIGAGLADGLGFGANARTALITRGLTEMARLGQALGAQAETFMGMAGLGDLVLTCTDNQSRNRRFGLALGQGMSVDAAMESIGQVVEGYRNTEEVATLAARFGVEMPITEQLFAVLYRGLDAKQAALALLGRDPKKENS